MTEKIINTNIEILGKLYSIRCEEAELKALQESSSYLNQKMLEVQESGKAINLERIAIMAALNISNELLHSGKQKSSIMDKINLQITNIQDRIERVLTMPEQTEFVYPTE